MFFSGSPSRPSLPGDFSTHSLITFSISYLPTLVIPNIVKHHLGLHIYLVLHTTKYSHGAMITFGGPYNGLARVGIGGPIKSGKIILSEP